MANQVLTYVGDQIILNYTSGEICHKVYERSTNIYFSCNPDRNPVSLTHTENLLLLCSFEGVVNREQQIRYL